MEEENMEMLKLNESIRKRREEEPQKEPQKDVDL